MKWAQLGAAIAAEVTASLALQAAGGLTLSPWLLVVAAGYVTAFWLLGRVLALGIPIGVAYGIWGASGVALTAVLAHFLFDGPLNAVIGLGIALIVAGVIAVELGSQHATPTQTATTDDGATA